MNYATDSYTIDENTPDTLLSKVSGVVRVGADSGDAFNTSSDFSRIRMARVVTGNAFPDPLFIHSESITLSIKNNCKPNNALGVLGAFEITAGTFEVGGSITAYFSDVAAVQAVRDNADVTLDMCLVKQNAGFSLDLPLIALGNGQAAVVQDEAIKIPLDSPAATGASIDSTLDHTAMLVIYDYRSLGLTRRWC